MQTRFLSSVLVAFTAILLFASCSSSNKEGVYIPKNAAFVVHMNGASLSEKLPWEEVKKSGLLKEASSDTSVSAFLKSALDNPDNTGIDVKKDLIVFVQKDSLGGYVSVVGTVKDAAKFKQFGQEATKGGASSEKDGIGFITKEKVTISWKKDNFIVVIDIPEMNDINKYGKYDAFDTLPAPAVTYRDGIAAATALYSLKEDNSLAKDEKFSDLMKTKGDLHFWINGESFNKGNPAMAALAMVNLNKITEGSIMAATANFEDGKIIADIKSYSGKELSEIWKKYSGDKINSEMVKRIPSKDIAAFFALNFKPEGIREFLKLSGMEGFVNMGTAYAGFTLDDFIKANKGDVLLVISDIKNDTLSGKDASVIFATSIGDKDAFGKLVAAGKKFGEKEMGSMGAQVAFNSNENYFAIGNKKENIDKYITASGSNTFDFLDKIAGSPAGGYINFQYIFNSLKDEVKKDSIDNEMFLASAKLWDNLVAKGGEFKDGAINQHIEVNLVDKKTNSLKQLNTYLATMAALQKIKSAQRAQAWSDDWQVPADSSTVVTPAY